MPDDPPPPWRLILDLSDVTALRIGKREREYPVTPADLAIAFYICQHGRYPDLLAVEIHRWLRTPLGAAIEAAFLGHRPRGSPPGPRHDPDRATFARRVIAAMQSLLRGHRPVHRYIVAQHLHLSTDTYTRTLDYHHLDHDDLLRRALDP